MPCVEKLEPLFIRWSSCINNCLEWNHHPRKERSMGIIKNTRKEDFFRSQREIAMAEKLEQQAATVDYIAMMTDVDLPIDEEGGENEPEI